MRPQKLSKVALWRGKARGDEEEGGTEDEREKPGDEGKRPGNHGEMMVAEMPETMNEPNTV